MSQLPPPLPPLVAQPPPLRAQPIVEYANQRRPRPSFAHQAAKASWVTPIIAFVLGSAINATKDADRRLLIALGGLNILLLVTGLSLGVLAAFGIRRHGSKGILAPSMVGIAINGVFLLGVAGMLLLTRIGIPATATSLTAAPPMTPARYQAEALYGQPGWAGVIAHDGAEFALVEIAPNSTMNRDIQHVLEYRSHFLILAIDNSANQSSIAVDVSLVELLDGDDKLLAAFSLGDMSRNLTATAIAGYFENDGMPTVIPAGAKKPIALAVYIPDETDLAKVKQFAIHVDGKTLLIPGGILSVQEKQQNRRVYDSCHLRQ